MQRGDCTQVQSLASMANENAQRMPRGWLLPSPIRSSEIVANKMMGCMFSLHGHRERRTSHVAARDHPADLPAFAQWRLDPASIGMEPSSPSSPGFPIYHWLSILPLPHLTTSHAIDGALMLTQHLSQVRKVVSPMPSTREYKPTRGPLYNIFDSSRIPASPWWTPQEKSYECYD